MSTEKLNQIQQQQDYARSTLEKEDETKIGWKKDDVDALIASWYSFVSHNRTVVS